MRLGNPLTSRECGLTNESLKNYKYEFCDR